MSSVVIGMKGEKETENVEVIVKPKRSKRCIIAAVVLLVCFVIIVAVIIAVTLKSSNDKVEYSFKRNIVLLVSLDGFRYDYLHRGLTPNLNKLGSDGVQADFMRPQYPTSTFPNHYTIVTGLYPESHGIVSNNFLDGNDRFRLRGSVKHESNWWKGEPLWITAMKQGLKTASFFWVGSEAVIQGKRPNYWKKFNTSVPFSSRIDQVISWIKLPTNKRPDFITLYFEEPDRVGHVNGPVSDKVNQHIKIMDQTIGELFTKLKNNALIDKVNVIVVSDHGMAQADCNQIVYLNSMINSTNLNIVGLGASSLLYPQSQAQGHVLYDQLKCSNEHLTAFYRNSIYTPKRLHYSNNKRIGDIVLMPDLNWNILIKNGTCYSSKKGYHGIDNILKEMQAIFIASGPDFKSGYKVDHFQNIEVYNLLADLLNIKPAPNNGTSGSLYHLLKVEVAEKLELPDHVVFNNKLCPFPKDYAEVLKNCKYCVCPYCNYNVSVELIELRKNFNLSSSQIVSSHTKHFPWSLPQENSDGNNVCVLTQHNYVTGYDTQLHLPLWVGYKLTKAQLLTNVPRSNCFRRDIRLNASEASYCSDYTFSGYDRGHLAPSGDFNYNVSAEQDTFVLSNVAPQHKYFNRYSSTYGAWYYLEDLTRKLALKYDSIYVISGSIFDTNNDGLKDDKNANKRWLKNDTNSIPIPTHYYKILTKCKTLGKTQCDELDTLAFILPHNEEKLCTLKTLASYVNSHVASIRDVELLTGLTFFGNLKTSNRAHIVSKLNTDVWSYLKKVTYNSYNKF